MPGQPGARGTGYPLSMNEAGARVGVMGGTFDPTHHGHLVAAASNPQFTVSRVDIDRQGPTYTIDTLRDLRATRNPADQLFFITGADALARIMSWRNVDELFSLAHFVGVTRPGHRLSVEGLPDGKVSLIEVPALTISSTACRGRVAKGEPIWYLVPDGIVQYIAKRRLYARESR